MCFTRLYQIHGCTIKCGHYRVLSSLEMHNNMLISFTGQTRAVRTTLCYSSLRLWSALYISNSKSQTSQYVIVTVDSYRWYSVIHVHLYRYSDTRWYSLMHITSLELVVRLVSSSRILYRLNGLAKMSDLSIKQTSKPWRSSHNYCYLHWHSSTISLSLL